MAVYLLHFICNISDFCPSKGNCIYNMCAFFCVDTCFIPVCFAAYTIAKYGMTMCALGMSGELRDDGVAVNTLWPRTGKLV